MARIPAPSGEAGASAILPVTCSLRYIAAAFVHDQRLRIRAVPLDPLFLARHHADEVEPSGRLDLVDLVAPLLRLTVLEGRTWSPARRSLQSILAALKSITTLPWLMRSRRRRAVPLRSLLGNDFVRVATNVKKDDGSRAIGTVLDPKGKAIAAISKGASFYGEVPNSGNWLRTDSRCK